MSYNADVYVKQGAKELVVSSSGTLAIESGGEITLPASQLGTSQVGTALPSVGVSTITASTTAPNYTLGAPSAGNIHVIRCEANTSSGTATVTTTAAFDAAGSKNRLVFDAADEAVTLFGISSTGWMIVGNVGSVATTSG